MSSVNAQETYILLEAARAIGPKALEFLTWDFAAEGVKEAPYDHGHLSERIIPGVEQVNDWKWIVQDDAEYAVPVHDGHLTRPAIKHPKKAKGQRWVKGNPFFERAKNTVEGKIEMYFDLAIAELNS